MKKAAARLLLGGVLLLAATVLLSVPAFSDSLSALLPILPYLVFGGGILLAWRFDRSRLVLALLTLALAERTIGYFAAGEAGATRIGRIVFNAVTLLLPVNLGVLPWLPERGLRTAQGRWSAGLLLAQPLVITLICLPELASIAAALEHRFWEAGVFRAIALPQPALLAFGVAGALATLRFIRQPNAIEAGSLWGLVATFLALRAGSAGPVSTVYLTAAGLLLAVALVETSHRMAYEDELTGLQGRRALNEALRRLGDRYAIAMMDIDHFKRFNDAHGHEVGDQLLRMVAARLAKVGGGGKGFRYGGEEFAVIFPGKSATDAVPHLEAVRRAMEGSAFTVRGAFRPRKKPETPRPRRGRKRVFATVSVGVADADPSSTPEEVLEAADTALYRAKKAGRNRVSQ